MTQREHLDPPPGPSRSAVRDELLECLQTIALIHDHAATAETLTAGLPLEEGRLTPAVFPRAASRAGLTARIVKSRLVQLNPALLPAVLLLEPGRACVLMALDLKARRARVVFPELGEAETEVGLDGLQSSYGGQAIYVRPRFHFDARGPEVNKQRARQAARRSVQEAPAMHSVALVTFSDSATLVVPPTTDRGGVIAAIDQAQPGAGGTRYRTALSRASEAIASGEGTITVVTETQVKESGRNDLHRSLF